MLARFNWSVFSNTRYRIAAGAFLVLTFFALILNISSPSRTIWGTRKSPSLAETAVAHQPTIDAIAETSRSYVEHPLSTAQFGEMGWRVQAMRDWVVTQDQIRDQITIPQRCNLSDAIEGAALATFPFLHNPADPPDWKPLHDLRQRFVPGSKGIVIPTGKGTFRFACHLISSLRDVLKSELPIQIMYAGEDDLPADHRDVVIQLGSQIETVDITTVLDDETLQLAKGGWAIKAFAALASSFEQVILMDADAVFLQKPEVILNDHPGYQATGSLLFHDRLLWQGAFPERHQWWENQMKGHIPSATLNVSKVYNDGYAEEGDSGVVALHKGRLPILMGLLHICWQNTLAVREAVTYHMGYGDKESWWFGLELSGAAYTMEAHYGAILGWATAARNGQTKVCSFTIAHLDLRDRLLWYNGSLLKNKAVDKLEFEVPTHWMVDAVWEKGATKPDVSCMRDGLVKYVTDEESRILSASVEAAKKVDVLIIDLVGL